MSASKCAIRDGHQTRRVAGGVVISRAAREEILHLPLYRVVRATINVGSQLDGYVKSIGTQLIVTCAINKVPEDYGMVYLPQGE